MARIRNESGQRQVVAGKMAAKDDDNDDIEDEAKASMAGNHELNRSGGSEFESSAGLESKSGDDRITESNLVPSNVFENKSDAAKDTSRDLDEAAQDGHDEFVGDSLVLDYNEYEFDEDNEHDASYFSEGGVSYNQFDAQSLGAGTDDELGDVEGYVPTINVLSEEQLDEQLSEQRDKGDNE